MISEENIFWLNRLAVKGKRLKYVQKEKQRDTGAYLLQSGSFGCSFLLIYQLLDLVGCINCSVLFSKCIKQIDWKEVFQDNLYGI